MLPRAGITRTTSGYRSIRETLNKDAIPSDSITSLPTVSPSASPYLLFLVFIATLGPFQFGFHLGELNAPQTVIICKAKSRPTATHSSSFLPQCIPMTDPQWGMVQSIFTIGGLLGSLAVGPVATRYGRLIAMMALTCTLAIGSAIEATAFSIISMSLGRFTAGLGAGAATVVCPIYIAEISPADRRGLFGAFCQVMINSGILVAQVLGYFLSHDSQWRIILAFPSILSVFTLIALFFAPDTPAWLADNGKLQHARIVLHHLRAPDADLKEEMKDWRLTPSDEETALLSCPQQPHQPQYRTISFLEVITLPNYRKAVIAVTATFIAQQLTGINAVMMYSVSILGDIIPSAAALVTVTVSAINVFISVICTPLPDKIGRKSCLLLSIAGMGLSSILLALGLSHALSTLTIVAVVAFVASFSLGLGPVPFIIMGEVVGPEAVGALSSWALAGNWLSTFAVAQFFPMLNGALPEGGVFWVFAVVALALGGLIAWKVPESKGKANAEEVWAAFEGR